MLHGLVLVWYYINHTVDQIHLRGSASEQRPDSLVSPYSLQKWTSVMSLIPSSSAKEDKCTHVLSSNFFLFSEGCNADTTSSAQIQLYTFLKTRRAHWCRYITSMGECTHWVMSVHVCVCLLTASFSFFFDLIALGGTKLLLTSLVS